MIIGVVSDTHSFDVPNEVFQAFEKVDMIIHAGDMCLLEDIKPFQDLKPVHAVFGNMDDSSVRKAFPAQEIIECEGVTIGLCHGHGSPRGGLWTAQETFVNKGVDAVVFGHTHLPYNEVEAGVLYFNPGSPNDVIRAPYFSYGILEVKKNQIKGKIVKIGK